MNEYPTEEELDTIRNWPIGKYRELAEYVCAIWHWGEPWCRLIKKQDGSYTLRLATGGWSGNEDIIGALHDNMFQMVCWEMSKRGGLFVYKIPANMAEVEPSSDKSGCINPVKP